MATDIVPEEKDLKEFSYLANDYSSQWFNFFRKLTPHVHFTEFALLRLGQVLGFLDGVTHADHAIGQLLSSDFLGHIIWLERLTSVEKERHVVLFDDGTMNCFLFHLVKFVPEGQHSRIIEVFLSFGNKEKIYCNTVFNGGLMYSGPRGRETFTVQLVPTFGWSLHS